MPYDNVPASEWDAMDRCKRQVMEQGYDEEGAIRICYASIVEGKAFPEGITVNLDLKPEGEKAARIIKLPFDMMIKAAGDWQLDVLAVPFGGPNNGKDADGEMFTARTEIYADTLKEIPVFYYHGYTPDLKPQGLPVQIGTAKYDHTDEKGHWYRVVLNKAVEFARRIWEAAKQGIARASSGSIAHLVRINEKTGEILSWPVAELSLIDAEGKRQPANSYAVAVAVMKAHYANTGQILPDIKSEKPEAEAEARPAQSDAAQSETNQFLGVTEMEPNEIQKLIADALKADREAREAEQKALAEQQAKIDAAVKAALETKEREEAAKRRRLPFGDITIAKHSEEWAYDNLDAADQAVLVGVLESAKKTGRSMGASEAAIKALARKLEADKTPVGEVARQAMKRAAIKSDEVDYSTLTSYGDEWVGIAYSQAIWDAIRVGTFVAQKLPSVEVPQGFESMYLPLESTDPVWYKVAENTTYDGTMKTPVATVTSSRLGTGRVQLTLGKMGARVLWTGEMEERSLIPFINQLRRQLSVSGAEALEDVIINGDTATSNNINDIGGTTYSGTATTLFLLTNGFRKSPLVTTTANSRSAAGGFQSSDFIETLKLMGGGGINALDRAKVEFIIDPTTHYKSLTLEDVKTRDVFSAATIEQGRLVSIYGYNVNISGQMCKKSSVRLSNTAGKVDNDNVANNAYGSILAVRWDQWTLGYQRRMTMETTRFANSDTNEIVAMMNIGLIQRDTEASSITYYVGV